MRKSVEDLDNQMLRISRLMKEAARGGRDTKALQARYDKARKAYRRYETNMIKVQTKGMTEEQMNSGMGASYRRKIARSAYMGLG